MRPLSYSPRPSVLVVTAAVIVLSGCRGAIDSAVFMSAAPAVAADDVRIYSTSAPACAYDELGVVTWRPSHGWQKLQGGVDRMRARAAEMGGHAITEFAVGERNINTSRTADTSVDSGTFASGTVIRFREGGCATP